MVCRSVFILLFQEQKGSHGRQEKGSRAKITTRSRSMAALKHGFLQHQIRGFKISGNTKKLGTA